MGKQILKRPMIALGVLVISSGLASTSCREEPREDVVEHHHSIIWNRDVLEPDWLLADLEKGYAMLLLNETDVNISADDVGQWIVRGNGKVVQVPKELIGYQLLISRPDGTLTSIDFVEEVTFRRFLELTRDRSEDTRLKDQVIQALVACGL